MDSTYKRDLFLMNIDFLGWGNMHLKNALRMSGFHLTDISL